MAEKYEYEKLVGKWEKDPNHLFDWCHVCDLFLDCYVSGGPMFLEPSCGEGPYKE
jgi:hypothetical protein